MPTSPHGDNSDPNDRACILVVDDERGPRESLYFLLKREFDVVLANSVDHGVEALKASKPDLIIMDIRMPGRSGIEGLSEMRTIAPDVSIIMLTGYGTLETAQEAIRHGAADYLKKPFDTTEMLEVVRRNISRTRMNQRRSAAEQDLAKLSQTLRSQLQSHTRLSTLGLASSELVHDLRNPLGVILGYTELLGEDLKQIQSQSAALPPDTLDYLKTIEKNVRVCTELTEMWRTLGSGNARQAPPLSLWPLLEELVKETRRPSTDIRLELQGTDRERTAQIHGDALQLRRAFQNLVGNALDAVHPRTGLVRIQCACDAQSFSVCIEDNGCGIDPARLDRIFEPFHDTSKGRKGTGLGLFIARKVVDDHAGTIDIDSELSRGTRVTVRIPLVDG